MTYIIFNLYSYNCSNASLFAGPGINIENRIGRSFQYTDTIDYVCKQGYVYNKVVTRRRILCELPVSSGGQPSAKYVRWNDTALACSSTLSTNMSYMCLRFCCLFDAYSYNLFAPFLFY